MSYTVLARKYRPKNFAELIGQETVVRALSNALNNNRLHHAYLLTGTRGVGKTTLGRILAKCLNCAIGITATPCEKCASCVEINTGRSLDLIEIDAASNTKVEDTRDLLDNVQYAPSRDRFKIYLIDEVHMLSNHSFNALLKTLEEPPEHVKFILATTDPQKLPITVLSRCLQFNLRAMTATQITEHLHTVLAQEQLSAESQALLHLAHAADGSMRDALSLLDQAIAYSNNQITEQNIQEMLGITPAQEIFNLLSALQQHDATKLFNAIENLSQQAIDYETALESILAALHKIAVAQALPEAIANDVLEKEMILQLAKQITKEDVQLYYQIAVIGRRDLALAPAPRAGFEMTLLRMLSFTLNNSMAKKSAPVTQPVIEKSTPSPQIVIEKPVAQPAVLPIISQDASWENLIEHANLSGVTKVLAMHCALKSRTEDSIELEVDPAHASIASSTQQQKLQEALQTCLGKAIKLTIHKTASLNETPAIKEKKLHDQKQQQALENITNDPNLQNLMSQFGASLQADTVTPTN